MIFRGLSSEASLKIKVKVPLQLSWFNQTPDVLPFTPQIKFIPGMYVAVRHLA